MVNKPKEVRIAKSMVSSILLGKIIRYSIFTVASLFLLYVVFAATLVRVIPSFSGTGPILVKNITTQGSVLPTGSLVAVNMVEPETDDFISHLKQAFVPTKNYSVMKVEAGPYGRLFWVEPDLLTVDGNILDVKSPVDDNGKNILFKRSEFLKNEYVLSCVSGNCADIAYIYPQEHIVGQVIEKKG